jgi:hypothetical protein
MSRREPKTTGPLPLEVVRQVEAEPPFWVRLPGQPWVSKPKPAAEPFDLEGCLQRVRTGYEPKGYRDKAWRKSRIAPALAPEEARFWLEAMTRAEYGWKEKPEDLARTLAKGDYRRPLSVTAIVKKIREAKSWPGTDIALALGNLLSPGQFFDLLSGKRLVKNDNWHAVFTVLEGFREYILPSLTEAEAAAARDALRERLDPADDKSIPWTLAAYLGMTEELREHAAAWPDGHFEGGRCLSWVEWPHVIAFNLGDGKLTESVVRRTKIDLLSVAHVRAWLALTKWHALDLVRDAIVGRDKASAEPTTRAFAGVRAPEAAPFMLELKLTSKGPAPARQWLDDNPAEAIAGLVPVAAGKGKLADAAVEYLREADRLGRGPFIEEQLRQTSAEVAGQVRGRVFGRPEKVHAVLDARSTPPWLRDAVKGVDAANVKLPDWVRPTNLPPLLVGGRRLTEGQLTAVLAALKQTGPARGPLVEGLRRHADAAARDAFAWRLFELWLGEGAPTKEKWAFAALGHLGGDAAALKLGALVRAWPGEGQHKRAVEGLECLRAIGTDTALMQLNGIAQRVKFKAIQSEARQLVAAVAEDRGLTREQLEDRIVPDLGLDERGGRTLDFGPRQFRTALGPDLRPLVRDGDGKLKEDLPKPGAKDDADRAAAAVADWKLLKKQLREAVKVQAFRLEQAMVIGRRWTPDEFAALLVRHPLLVNLVRWLLWAGYDARGKRVAAFRVTEEREYADARDKACPLKGAAAVGVVHPLHLAEAERAAWGEVFADYEIIPPFPQLGRPVYRVEGDEAKETELTRFAGVRIPGVSVAGHLERSGWQRGLLHDHGDFHEHYKQFPGANVTAVAEYDESLWAYDIADPHSVAVKRCTFLKGLVAPEWSWRRQPPKPLPLGKVDPVALSEVLADLTFLASKAE